MKFFFVDGAATNSFTLGAHDQSDPTKTDEMTSAFGNMSTKDVKPLSTAAASQDVTPGADTSTAMGTESSSGVPDRDTTKTTTEDSTAATTSAGAGSTTAHEKNMAANPATGLEAAREVPASKREADKNASLDGAGVTVPESAKSETVGPGSLPMEPQTSKESPNNLEGSNFGGIGEADTKGGDYESQKLKESITKGKENMESNQTMPVAEQEREGRTKEKQEATGTALIMLVIDRANAATAAENEGATRSRSVSPGGGMINYADPNRHKTAEATVDGRAANDVDSGEKTRKRDKIKGLFHSKK